MPYSVLSVPVHTPEYVRPVHEGHHVTAVGFLMSRAPVLVAGVHGYRLHYDEKDGDDSVYITERGKAFFCWYCRQRACQHVADLARTLFRAEDDAA